jgi:uncharacterized protein (TIGR00369 family)
MNGKWKCGDAMKQSEGRAAALTVPELEAFLRAEFPQVFNADSGVAIEDAWHGGARVRQAWREASLRPGGTISGATMMALADFAMYVAVLASIGPVPLAVTTSLNINFLRKPGRGDLIAEAKLMKLGKRLAVGEVGLQTAGDDDLVAHVTATYSIPAPRHG